MDSTRAGRIVEDQFFRREPGHRVERPLCTSRTAVFHRLSPFRCKQVGNGVVLKAGMQMVAAKAESLSTVAVGQKAEVADLHEAGGQDVEQETADKFHCFQSHHFEAFAILGVPPAKADPIFDETDQSAVRDGHTVGIASQIFEHMVGASQGRLGIDDPLGRAELIEPSLKFGRIRERLQLAVQVELPLGKSSLEKAQ